MKLHPDSAPHEHPDSATSSPPLILVVGMHRSGTSLLGSILQAIGVATPGELIAGDANNPEGYFERRDVTDLQEQLLIDLGRWWPSAEGVFTLPPDWLLHSGTQRVLDQLRSILAAESLRQERPWAIKDPRTSLLLPLWRRVCGELRIPLRLLLAVRDPAEVAASLCRRDAEAAGMTPARAEQLWWRHYKAVLDHSVDLPLVTIDYGRWFDSPQSAQEQLLQLMEFCDLPPSSSDVARASDLRLEAALQQIRPEHRRSRAIALPGQTPAQMCYRQLRSADAHSASAVRSLQTSTSRSVRRRLRLFWLRFRNRRRFGATSWSQLQAWFEPSFYSSRYLDQQHDLDPFFDYLTRGWRQGHQPHPLFDPAFYLLQCHRRGIVPGDERPLLAHFLSFGLRLHIPCTPLLEPHWFQSQGSRYAADAPPALSDLHPWGQAALALADHDLAAAACLLHHWLERGLNSADVWTIHKVDRPWLRWPAHDEIPVVPPARINRLRSLVLPSSHWLLYGWRASLVDPVQRDDAEASLIDAALLIPLRSGEWPSVGELRTILQSRELLLDPDPCRCRTWRRLGCAVARILPPTPSQLDAWLPGEPWLDRAAVLFDLPGIEALNGMQLLVLGPGGDSVIIHPKPATLHLPSFPRLMLENDDKRRCLAAWLWHCQRRGMQLHVLRDDRTSSRLWCWLPMELRDSLRPFPG